MSESVPRRIGAYEVVAALGAGGMGEVYRARDPRLGRDVALKILPDLFSRDPERLARFEREAKTLASLNHPHIAQIYGLEESGGTRALVMELVEGEDLSVRIARGPVPVEEALPIARQIAEALEAAHELGIIHRDLKPSNIRIRHDGTVKVLDFGLAKAFDPTASGAQQETLTSPAVTMRGVILGTAAYMAPEQARGRALDKRADIWAFGVVMYEMLTGTRLFDADSVAETIGLVATRAIDLGHLPANVPLSVRALLRRCLERDARRRLRDIGEARVVLEGMGLLDEDAQAPPASSAPRVGGAWTLALITLVAIAVGSAGWYAGRRQAPEEASWRAFTQLTNQAGEETTPAISPDGASIAYASRARGTWDIYVQRVGGRNPILVAGDTARHESAPAFSPDGVSIAFHESDRDGGIFTVGATGESARRLTDFSFNPNWSPDGKRIVFCTEEVAEPFVRHAVSSLWVVHATGDGLRRITDGDAIQPAWSPSGGRIAFWANEGGQRDLFTISADGGARQPVLTDAPIDWNPTWSPDGSTIVFSSDRGGSMNLWRVRIDQDSGRALGPPAPITAGVHTSADWPTLSKDGSTIVFRAQVRSVNPAVMAFDPTTEKVGEPRPLIVGTGSLAPTSVSPDGQWLLLTSQGERQDDVLVCRTDGSGLRRLTDDVYRDRWPRWAPDGNHVVFYSNRSGRYEVWIMQSDGSGRRKISDQPERQAIFPIISPAGTQVIASAQTAGKSWIAELSRPWALSVRLLEGIGTADEWLIPVDWSPDGRRLVGPIMPRTGLVRGIGVYDLASQTMRKVTDAGDGYSVAWLPDGRRAVRLDGDGERVFLVDVDTGRQRPLLNASGYRFNRSHLPVISRDGRSIYVGQVHVQSDVWMVNRE